jgi:hypothetical protein
MLQVRATGIEEEKEDITLKNRFCALVTSYTFIRETVVRLSAELRCILADNISFHSTNEKPLVETVSLNDL